MPKTPLTFSSHLSPKSVRVISSALLAGTIGLNAFGLSAFAQNSYLQQLQSQNPPTQAQGQNPTQNQPPTQAQFQWPQAQGNMPGQSAGAMSTRPQLAPQGQGQPNSAYATPGMSPSATSALKVETGSQKVPVGTMLTIAFNTPMDSKITNTGDPFTASLTKDFTVAGKNGERRMILPAGTMIRGRVDQVKRPNYFSHGGAIFLAFDHVVLPSGELLPLTLNLSTENTIVNQKGALYSDPGIGRKIERGAEDGRKAFSGMTEQGFEAGKQIAGGLGSIVTVPAAVIGGALAGTAITTGKAAVAIVGKGESMVIKPGDTVTIDFGGSFNLPTE